MKRIFLSLPITLNIYAVEFQPIHSSVQLYAEKKNFINSKQKTEGIIYGIGGDFHLKNSEIRFSYEHGETKTKQPPLKKDLTIEKFFLRYAYKFDKNFTVNFNYLSIPYDNIAITDGGLAYGIGVSYFYSKQLGINFTQFYTDYKDFNVYQSNFNIDFKTQIGMYKIKLSSKNLSIGIDEKEHNLFTKNAKKRYFTSAIKLHVHYNTWHFGTAAYFGQRAFAIMNDGFKIQHHAMEFDKTYAVGIGKNIAKSIIRLQCIFQEATELPINNDAIKIQNIRIIANYKF